MLPALLDSAAKNITAADDHGDLDAEFVDLLDLFGDGSRDVYVDAGGLLTNQRLAGNLQEYAAKSWARYYEYGLRLWVIWVPEFVIAWKIQLRRSKYSNRRTSGQFRDLVAEIVAAFLQAFAHFVTREAADRNLLAGLGDFLGDQLADGFLFFFDERLIKKTSSS